MSARPTTALPGWLVSNAAKRVEPSGSQKTNGWDASAPLPAQSLNWLLYSTSLWLQYFSDIDSSATLYLNTNHNLSSSSDRGRLFLIDTSTNIYNMNLCDPSTFSEGWFEIKDYGLNLDEYAFNLVRFSTEKINMYQGDLSLDAVGGSWKVRCNGTEWFVY